MPAFSSLPVSLLLDWSQCLASHWCRAGLCDLSWPTAQQQALCKWRPEKVLVYFCFLSWTAPPENKPRLARWRTADQVEQSRVQTAEATLDHPAPADQPADARCPSARAAPGSRTFQTNHGPMSKNKCRLLCATEVSWVLLGSITMATADWYNWFYYLTDTVFLHICW